MAEPIACIDLLRMPTGEPGVRLSASPDFMDMDAIEKCMYIAAAIQLCGAAINAICEDNPDVAEEIRERFMDVSLVPSSERMN